MIGTLLSVAMAAVAGATAPGFPRRDPSTAAFPHYGGQREVYSLKGDWEFQFLNYTVRCMRARARSLFSVRCCTASAAV